MKSILTLIIGAILLCAPCAHPRKIKAMKGGKTASAATLAADSLQIPGTFVVTGKCADTDHGYTLNQVTYSGYDKTAASARETFFITNGTDRTLAGVSLYIDYLTLDSLQMHRRFIHLPITIPPGETRRADIRSWDSQKTLYYRHSPHPRKKATPYDIIFTPIALYLKY